MRPWRLWPLLFFLAVLSPLSCAAGLRVIVLKLDGVPADVLNEALAARDPATGRSRLPWIQHVFAENGTRIDRFFVRGISLSAPSWSLLDTGRHLAIRGNVEYDRHTLRVYDYLNFFPFYVNYARSHRVDMPGVEVLDSLGLPLISDHFPYRERFQSFQLLQRGVRWKSLQHAAQKRFSKSPKQLFDEWETGFEVGNMVNRQTERELLQHAADPSFRYLDYFTGDFDHVAHLTPDRESQWRVLEEIDTLVGRVWTAIENSALASQTVLAMVSDHGMNTEPGVYSQGFSLLDFLNSRAGGGHHVITNRHPLSQYKLRGLDPFVSEVTTASGESLYLKGESGDFPTAALDLDGNERASVWLRNSDVNELQILLRALDRGEVKGSLRTAVVRASLGIVERHRAEWQTKLQDLQLELAALHRCAAALEAEIAREPRKWTAAQRASGLDKQGRRLDARLFSWRNTERRYGAYAQRLANLLSLEEKSFEPGAGKLEALIPKRFLGDPNSHAEVRDYIAGPSAAGLVLMPSGALDIERSFVHIDYPALLLAQRVRNQPQPQVGVQPVDFVAATIPREKIAAALSPEDRPNRDAVWLYSGEDDQALVLSRRDAITGAQSLRYLPIAHLRADAAGAIHFDAAPWSARIPLHYWEDPKLRLPEGTDRAQWLAQWHPERDWFRAIADTRYSNGLIGIVEQMVRDPLPPLASSDDQLVRRFELQLRAATTPDFEVFASNHWNFNVRGFNPGGNHGSFFHISTHSVLMFAGPNGTGIPRGLAVEEPYDSLSFAPTILALAGLDRGGDQNGPWPGPPIKEVLH